MPSGLAGGPTRRTRRPGLAPRLWKRRAAARGAREAEPAVAVVVRVCRAALVAVDQESRVLARHRAKPALAVALEQQAPSGIVSRKADRGRLQILAQGTVLH